MSITNYTELQTAIGNWSKRGTDSALTPLFPDFIRLCEVRLNRKLRVSAMETTFTSVALVSGAASLPSDFRAFKELRYDGSPSYTLEPKTEEWIRNQADLAAAPEYFAVTGSQVICWPQAGNIKGTYYASIAPLASSATNWVLTNHPDLYLFGSLTELADYIGDDESLTKWAARFQAMLDEVQSEDRANQMSGGPLVARKR
jgi:hypothetical protein